MRSPVGAPLDDAECVEAALCEGPNVVLCCGCEEPVVPPCCAATAVVVPGRDVVVAALGREVVVVEPLVSEDGRSVLSNETAVPEAQFTGPPSTAVHVLPVTLMSRVG